MSLWGELRRRGVVRSAAAYLAIAWLVVQVVAVVQPAFAFPNWVLQAVIVAFVLGFPIVLAISWRYELTAAGLQRDSAVGGNTPRVSRHGRALDFAIIGSLTLAVAVLVVDRYFLDEDGSLEIPTIAVLPLVNLSGDADRDYFVDGMTEAVIGSLARIRGIRVVSRRSVMNYKNSDTSLLAIAAQLGVRTILEGSAVYEGGRVQIMARLTDVASNTNLWADSYDREITNVLALQTELAIDVARGIAIALTPEEESRLLSVRQVDPATYEAYLRGMYYLNGSSPDDVDRGLAYMHEAVDKNPGDALAYAGLAIGYATVSHGIAPPEDAWRLASSAAQRAVTLDPDLAEAYLAIGNVKLYFEWDFPGALAALERAIELNPSLAMAHYHHAWYLALVGKLDEAIEAHTRARELDPLTPLHTAWLGSLYVYAGDYDAAIAEARRALQLNPMAPAAYFVLGTAYIGQGLLEEAINAHERLVEIDPLWAGMLGATYALAGRAELAREIIADREAMYELEPTGWVARDLAVVYAALGQSDDAAYWLTRSPYHAWIPWLAVDQLFEPLLRDDPLFRNLLTQLALPAGSCCYSNGLFGTSN